VVDHIVRDSQLGASEAVGLAMVCLIVSEQLYRVSCDSSNFVMGSYQELRGYFGCYLDQPWLPVVLSK
jgi:hypothetical protein